MALKQNGLPTPPVYEIRCDADVALAAKAVGFPAVLKPVPAPEPREMCL